MMMMMIVIIINIEVSLGDDICQDDGGEILPLFFLCHDSLHLAIGQITMVTLKMPPN